MEREGRTNLDVLSNAESKENLLERTLDGGAGGESENCGYERMSIQRGSEGGLLTWQVLEKLDRGEVALASEPRALPGGDQSVRTEHGCYLCLLLRRKGRPSAGEGGEDL